MEGVSGLVCALFQVQYCDAQRYPPPLVQANPLIPKQHL